MPRGAIPAGLEQAVRDKHGERLSHRQISDWLKSEHNVKASHAAVGRFLRESAAERKELITDQVQEVLVESATSDLGIYDENIKALARIAKKAEREWDAAVKAAGDGRKTALLTGGASARRDAIYAREAVAKALKGKLEMTGVGAPDAGAKVGMVILPALDPE